MSQDGVASGLPRNMPATLFGKPADAAEKPAPFGQPAATADPAKPAPFGVPTSAAKPAEGPAKVEGDGKIDPA